MGSMRPLWRRLPPISPRPRGGASRPPLWSGRQFLPRHRRRGKRHRAGARRFDRHARDRDERARDRICDREAGPSGARPLGRADAFGLRGLFRQTALIISAKAASSFSPAAQAIPSLRPNGCRVACGGTLLRCHLKATQVDGVYSADPKRDPTAVRYDRLTHDEAIAGNLAVMDTAAFALARKTGSPSSSFRSRNPAPFRQRSRRTGESRSSALNGRGATVAAPAPVAGKLADLPVNFWRVGLFSHASPRSREAATACERRRQLSTSRPHAESRKDRGPTEPVARIDVKVQSRFEEVKLSTFPI